MTSEGVKEDDMTMSIKNAMFVENTLFIDNLYHNNDVDDVMTLVAQWLTLWAFDAEVPVLDEHCIIYNYLIYIHYIIFTINRNNFTLHKRLTSFDPKLISQSYHLVNAAHGLIDGTRF